MRLTKLLFLLIGFLSAQTDTYQGKIVDSEGEPLAGVQVFLKDSYNGTTTNVDGEFSISSGSLGIFFIRLIGGPFS